MPMRSRHAQPRRSKGHELDRLDGAANWVLQSTGETGMVCGCELGIHRPAREHTRFGRDGHSERGVKREGLWERLA